VKVNPVRVSLRTGGCEPDHCSVLIQLIYELVPGEEAVHGHPEIRTACISVEVEMVVAKETMEVVWLRFRDTSKTKLDQI
jgi:hypothetical protein